MGEACSALVVLVGKPKGKTPFFRPRRRSKIETNIRKMGFWALVAFIWHVIVTGGRLL
jgi:hypothetical protein